MADIHFFKEDVRFNLLSQTRLRKWIGLAVRQNKFQLKELNFIFCSDHYLLNLNKKFLGHNFFTDIITFDNSEDRKSVAGDIFISYDRVKSNATEFKVPVKDELHRVMIHGVLHLLGYSDKTKKAQELMRKSEDEWLSKRNF